MKKTIYLLLFLGLTIQSCKKCVTCGNECWKCAGLQGKALCSNQYPEAQYESALAFMKANYDSCYLVTVPESKSVELCDKDAINLVEPKGYVCK